MPEPDLSKELYHCALQCGFDNCGVISLDRLSGFEAFYQKRTEDVPRSSVFYDNVRGLRGTRERFPWAKAIVILVFNYGKYRYPKELQGRYGKAFFLEPLKDSAIACDLQRFEQWFADHGIHAEGGEQFRTSSVGPLRYMAAQAGLGIIRKNNFFYTEQGSYNNLTGYVIDRAWELVQEPRLIPCGKTCDLCRKACKTKALQAEYTMDPLKCVSYWTTFGNSDIPQGLSPEMFEEWVCGCDNCQDACPHNHRHDWETGEEFPELEKLSTMILPQNFENLTDEFLLEQVIPRTASHLQPSDVPALRKNARRALDYQRRKQAQ